MSWLPLFENEFSEGEAFVGVKDSILLSMLANLFFTFAMAGFLTNLVVTSMNPKAEERVGPYIYHYLEKMKSRNLWVVIFASLAVFSTPLSPNILYSFPSSPLKKLMLSIKPKIFTPVFSNI